jgi:hypothetical protein
MIPSARHRSAAVLAAALVCLAVVMIIGASLLRTVLLQQRQLEQEQQQLQALWLAESAVERAAARLRDSPDYRGETWEFASWAPSPGSSGVAVIRIEPLAGDDARRQIVVEARYPQDGPHRVLQYRRIQVPLGGAER